MKRQDLEDPYLKGRVQFRRKIRCSVCFTDAFCIELTDYTFPDAIKVESTIISRRRPVAGLPHQKPYSFVPFIGINCGCYAKFHRQIAHIITNMNIRHRNEPNWEKIPTL